MSAADRDDQARDDQARDDQARDGRPGGDEDAAKTAESELASGDAATEVRPAAGESPPVGPAGTQILPPVPPDSPGGSRQESPEPRWAARASVPQPAPPVGPSDTDIQQWRAPSRGPLIPVLVTLAVVLLLGIFALGAWLALASRPGPTTQPSQPVQTQSSQPTPTPSSASPSPSPSPSASAPTSVPIPDLSGLTYDEAAAKITELGFTPQRRDEISLTVPQGEVIGTEPPEGTTLRPSPEIRIVIIVSTGPPAPSLPTAPSGSGPVVPPNP